MVQTAGHYKAGLSASTDGSSGSTLKYHIAPTNPAWYAYGYAKEYTMNTIPAQEIKKRGISAVDDKLRDGPVYVISRNCPRYVVMEAKQYEEWLDDRHEAFLNRVELSLADVEAGRVHEFNSTEEMWAAILNPDNEA
jgi:PHD/YefM family antitoxin component YafN of YafNO toxin-antitoxin module